MSVPTTFLSIFQPEHMLVIFLAVVLLFGGKKIPELMKGIGKGVREFKDAKESIKNDIEDGMNPKVITEPVPNKQLF